MVFFPGAVLGAEQIVQEVLGANAIGIIAGGKDGADIGQQAGTGAEIISELGAKDALQGGAGLIGPVAADLVSQEEEGISALLLMRKQSGERRARGENRRIVIHAREIQESPVVHPIEQRAGLLLRDQPTEVLDLLMGFSTFEQDGN